MIDLAVASIAGLALIGIVVVIVRKFPTLASIDTRTIPSERHGELKAKLMEERFRRKISRASGSVAARVKPVGTKLGTWLKTAYQRLLELEQKYRRRALSQDDLSPAERAKKLEEVGQAVAVARDALERGDYPTAERRAIEAISVYPRSVDAYRVLAQVYLDQKDYEHARETIRFVIDNLHVEDDELYAELGQADSGEGKLEEAKSDLETSIRLNNQVAGHYLDLCRVELELGDSAAAFENCKRAVELEPNNPKFLDALVEASIVAEKREWAVETLEKLKAVNPENQKLTELTDRVNTIPAVKKSRTS